MKKSFCGLLLITTILSTPIYASDDTTSETAITIYSKAGVGAIDPNSYRPTTSSSGYSAYNGANVPGYAIVKQVEKINLKNSEDTVKISDVAALIDPTTVQFKSLTDPKGTKVVEQDYQFDLVSQAKLLDKYIDKKVSVEKYNGTKNEIIEGTLLSTQGGLTLKTGDGIKAINSYTGINFSELPGGLITKPTLVWDIITSKIGEHKAELSYETAGVTWWADYNLTYKEGKDANSGTVDFSSWVSIINQSGATYNDAKLKLVAGNVEKVSPQSANMLGGIKALRKMEMSDSAVPEAPKFDEKSFFEYHLYTLNRPVTLPQNSTKQLELIPAVKDVPVEKELVYVGLQQEYWNWDSYYIGKDDGIDGSNKKVRVLLKLKNKQENGLGVALPAGRMRVNQRDSDGSLEFIGENNIDHTPRNEDISIKLGDAFDVVGESKQVNYTLDTRNRIAEEEIEVKIRNQKKQSVKVKVIENMYRATGWEILNSNLQYKKENAHQTSYLVSVDPEKEAVVTYKVRYKW